MTGKDTELLAQVEELRRTLKARVQEGGGDAELLQQASAALEQLQTLTQTLDGQLATMRYLASQRYRPKSEKVPAGQMALDLLGFLVQQRAETEGEADEPAAVPPPSPKPTRKKRKGALHLLEVRPVERTLPEDERRCKCCGKPMPAFDFEAKRHLVYEPAKLYFLEERLAKYACRTCEEGVVTAKGTPKLIEGSNASSSLLAQLVTTKLLDATPVERFGKQLSRHGADIASSTLHDWYNKCGETALLLQPATRLQLLDSELISFDDTPLLAMRAHGNSGTVRGRLWLYISDVGRTAYCEYTPDWKGKHPVAVLSGYSGSIQSDGYGGALSLFRGPSPPTRVGCNDHARRKFVDALKQGDRRAEPVIAIYAGLYAIEREAHRLSPSDRLELRAEKSAPLWQQLRTEVDRLSALGERKGPLGKGVIYFQRQHDALAAFLKDGHLPISNIHVERQLRVVGLFRKNSLFVGSVEAGKRYAALLTLALNCMLRDENPYAYFQCLFDRIAHGWPHSAIADLLPQFRLGPEQPLEQP